VEYELRPVTLDDLDALYAIHRAAMRDYVAATWGTWDEAFQTAFFRDHFDPAVRRAIVCEGTLAGFLDVREDETGVHLDNVELGPSFQGKGVGSEILCSLLSRGKPVRLQALKVNVRARRLYARLGFEGIGETETHVLMAWRSPLAERELTAWLDGPDRPDISNPIHSTAVARTYGFRGPLVGGVSVYGWCVPVILQALGDRWLSDGWIDLAFRRPVYPGDRLTIAISESESGGRLLQVHNQDGEACLRGSLGLGRAAWLDELALPVRRQAEPRPAQLPELTLDVAPVGQDLRPMPHEYRPETMAAYLDEKLQDADPRWRGPGALLHPGWIAAQMTPMLHHSYDYGPAIHTRTQAQHLSLAFADQTVTFAGGFVQAFERKGDHYAVIDGVMLGADGAELARLRHTTIFHVAPRA
jgi:RimJ/RimL family protein N-acetyltransferase